MNALARSLLALLAALSLAMVQGGALAQSRPAYSQQELDQMLAPIALYPDALLSQILMASTYPLEVAEAARWSRAHQGLDGDAAVRAVDGYEWDPSVKSLVAFPQVLERMDENPQWVVDLGDAFLGQETELMDTVQGLRRRAEAAGTLASDERVRVVPMGSSLIIAPTQPQLVYVPYYDPFVAYGTWAWPTYPPVYWRPWPGYRVVARPHRPHAALWWGNGVGLSAGFFFGNVDWHRRHVRVVRVDNYYYRRPAMVNNVHVANVHAVPGVWRHEPAHRRGFAYRNASVQDRFASTPAQFGERRVQPPSQVAAPVARPGAQPRERWEERRMERREDPRAQERPAAAVIAPPAARQTPPQRERQGERSGWEERRMERRQEPRAMERPAAAIIAPPAQVAAPAARPTPPQRERHEERTEQRFGQRHPGGHPVERPIAAPSAPAQLRAMPQARAAEPRVEVQRQREVRHAPPAHREARHEGGSRRPSVEARGHGRVELR